MRIARSILTLALVTAPCFGGDLENAWYVIHPIIHAKDEQRAASMRSASLVVLAEIQAVKVFEKPREVEKPPEAGGPMIPDSDCFGDRLLNSQIPKFPRQTAPSRASLST